MGAPSVLRAGDDPFPLRKPHHVWPLNKPSYLRSRRDVCGSRSRPAAHICSGHPAQPVKPKSLNKWRCFSARFKKSSSLLPLATFWLMLSAPAGGVPLEYSPFFWAHPLGEHPDPALFLSRFLSACWSLFRWSDSGGSIFRQHMFHCLNTELREGGKRSGRKKGSDAALRR